MVSVEQTLLPIVSIIRVTPIVQTAWARNRNWCCWSLLVTRTATLGCL
jgi:hypothetical protein